MKIWITVYQQSLLSLIWLKLFDTVVRKILLRCSDMEIEEKHTIYLTVISLKGNRELELMVWTATMKKLIFGYCATGNDTWTTIFILYIIDLLESLPKDSVIAHADDAAVIASNKDWATAVKMMNHLLKYLYTCLRVNKLSEFSGDFPRRNIANRNEWKKTE